MTLLRIALVLVVLLGAFVAGRSLSVNQVVGTWAGDSEDRMSRRTHMTMTFDAAGNESLRISSTRKDVLRMCLRRRCTGESTSLSQACWCRTLSPLIPSQKVHFTTARCTRLRFRVVSFAVCGRSTAIDSS